MNKSSRDVMTFSGGIHPVGDGKDLTCKSAVRTAPLLERYFVLLSENAGKPPVPVVKKGDKVQKYQLIAKADGFVSANLHAPTSGIVGGITEVPGPMGIPAGAVEIIADGEDVGVLSGGKATIILDKTPFYAEGGGQVGDIGKIVTDKGVFAVSDTKKTPEGQYLHIGQVEEGVIEKGTAKAKICAVRRDAIRRNHSSLHLLQAALREVLGTHVEQAGSYVNDAYGRFDFTHGSALTEEEIQKVEFAVNNQILLNNAVTTEIMTPDEARAKGAMALFGEKYGSSVRVVSMGDYSVELCGGTHVSATGSLGMFRIVSESSVAAGVRRIECVTGINTLNAMRSQEKLLENVKKTVKAVSNDDIINKTEQIINEAKALKKEIENINRKSASEAVDKAYAEAIDIMGFKLVRASFNDVTVDTLRDSADNVISKDDTAVCVFSTVNDGKVLLVAACGAEAVKNGAHAGNLLKVISPVVGGGGGGRPNSASSGGKDASKIPDALSLVANVFAAQVNKRG